MQRLKPPPLTAHREHWERRHCALVYEYDPTDDGPEVDIIRRIDEGIADLKKAISRALGISWFVLGRRK
jgi:hypothetical protein